MIRQWWFSAVLLVVYLATFQSWVGEPRSRILATGLLAVAILTLLWLFAWRQGYFVNRWDAAGHAAVVMDVAAEATWVTWHPDRSYVWCAVAFVVVIGGYRIHARRRRSRGPLSPSFLAPKDETPT